MNTKLTLRLDEERIEQAKCYAARTSKSVSRLVEGYFALLPDSDSTKTQKGVAEIALTPRVRSLLGLLEGAYPRVEAAQDDYWQHREKNIRGAPRVEPHPLSRTV
jgi:hypothetical protein